MTDSYTLPLYIESSAVGIEYFGLYAGGLGQYVIIRRTSTDVRRDLAYCSFTSRASFQEASATLAALQAQHYGADVPAGLNLNFLFAGSAVRGSNTPAAPSTTTGAVDQGGGDEGSPPTDSEAQMQQMQMQTARLAAIDATLNHEGGMPVTVDFPRQQHVLLDNRNPDEAIPVFLTSDPQLPYGAATQQGQEDIAQGLNAVLDQLAAQHVMVDNLPAPINGKLPVEVEFPAQQNVTGSISVNNFPASQAVTGPATNEQLRATPLPVTVPFPTNQLVTIFNPTLAVTGTFWQTTQPVSAASLPLPTGASTAALQSTGNAALASIDSKLTGPLAITGSITATPAAPRTSGGLTSRVVVSNAVSTTPTVVKASPGQLYALHLSNSSTGWAYVQFYNKATAPTVSDTIAESYGIPPGQTVRVSFDGLGSAFSTGIAFNITSNNGLLGTLTGLLVAGQVVVNVHYA